jgi:hypothetical protein
MSSGPPVDEIGRAVDWIELAFAASGRSRLTPSNMAELARLGDPDLADDDAAALVGDLFMEIERRADSAAIYPFEHGRRGLARRGEDGDFFIYLFLVLSATDLPFRKRGFKPYSRFEHVTRAALAEWTGGEAVVFADGAANVREAITALGDRLKVESFPTRARRARKDHGLDVAAWRPFLDGRAGLPIVLCQCTVARRKLPAKARDISVGEWSDLLRVRAASFTAAIAVPHVLDRDYVHWDELRRNTDLILDRIRLLDLLHGAADREALIADISKEIADGLTDWAVRHLPTAERRA